MSKLKDDVRDSLGVVINQSDFFANFYKQHLSEMSPYKNRKTGFASIDDNIPCFLPGLYVITGTPGSGKTTFVWQLLCNLARRGETCFCVSYEMTAAQMFCKAAACELRRRSFANGSGITPSSQQLALGCYAESAELQSVMDLPSPMVTDSASNQVDKLLAGLSKTLDDLPTPAHGIKPTLAIDYMQVLRISNPKSSARETVDEIVTKLKKFQKKYGITLLLISSLGRAGYNAEYGDLAVFKESGGIEFTADVALRLITADKGDKDKPRYVVLDCVKNRFGYMYRAGFEYIPQSDFFSSCDLRPEDVDDDDARKKTCRRK